MLYGADALGGAVVLNTKSADDYLGDDDAFNIGIRASALSVDEQAKLGVNVAGRVGEAGLLAQFTHRSFSEYDANTDVPLNPLDGSSDAMLLRADFPVGDRHALTATLDALDETIDLDLQNELGASVSSSLGRDITERERISLAYTWSPENRLLDSLQTQVYRQTSDALQHTTQTLTSYSFVSPLNPASFAGTQAMRLTDFEFDQEVAGIALNAEKAFGKGNVRHHVVYGLHRENTDTTRPRNRCETEVSSGAQTCAIAAYPFAPPEVFPNRTFPDARTRRGGAYVQDEIVFGPQGRMTLIPGLRYDSYEMDPQQTTLVDISGLGYELTRVDVDNVSGNLGFIFDVNDRLAFVAQYAEGFRPPNFDESNQAFVNRAFGYATVPNPDLVPETSRAYELGMRRSLARGSLSVTLYRNDYEDFIASMFVGATPDGISLFQDVNIGRAEIEGLEFESSVGLNDRWALRGGFSYSRGRDRVSDTWLDAIDPFTSIVGLSYETPDARWGVDTNLTAVAARTDVSADDRVTAPAYQLVDVIAKLQIAERSRLRLGVYNLFDEQYARWANLAGLAADSADAIGRAQGPGTHLRMSIQLDF